MKLWRNFLLPLAALAAGWLLGISGNRPISSLTNAGPLSPGTPAKVEVSGVDNVLGPSQSERHPVTHSRPLEPLSVALSHPSALHRMGAFAPRLKNLSAAQFAALNAELAALNPPPDLDVLVLFFRRWAQVSPEAALEAAIEKDLWSPVLMAWGERDPDAALARFEKLTFLHGFSAASTRDHLRALAMPKPGQLPPANAVKRIRELQGDGEATPAVLNAMSAILTEWAKTDPRAAWQEALTLPAEGKGRETREWALGSVIRTYTNRDPQKVEQWLNQIPDSFERGKLQAEYVSTLAGAGKVGQAREYALAMPEGTARQNAIGGLANALTYRDVDAAKAFVTNLPDSEWRDPSVFHQVFQLWLAKDADSAIELLLKRIPPDAPSGPEQQSAYESMFFGWSGRNPRQASELFLKLPEAIGAKLLKGAVAGFAYKDPPAAAQWAQALPEGATRDSILTQVAANWAGGGVTQVTQWLDQMPPGSGKSAAIEGFATTIISTSADDALAWLRAVPDERDRLDRLRRVWQHWSDREAARKWLNTSSELTDVERSALQEGAAMERR